MTAGGSFVARAPQVPTGRLRYRPGDGAAGRQSAVRHGAWAVPSADEVLASVSAQFGACSGAYEGTSGDSTVSITSQPLELTMPGATTSVCRLFSAVISGQGPLPGAICLGTSGDRLLGVMVTSFDRAVATTPEEYVALMTAATGKAFA